MKTWIVKFSVDDKWVRDGFDLTQERAERMIEAELPYSKWEERKAEVSDELELLEALKWLKNTFDFAVPSQEMRESYRPAYRNAIQQIAKAEGREE